MTMLIVIFVLLFMIFCFPIREAVDLVVFTLIFILQSLYNLFQ